MAQSSWPFENIDTTETQFSQWARNIGEGVRPDTADELEPFADNSGLNVKVRAGESLVRGHYYKSTAVETLTITAADLTNPRIDSVVLELDPVANTILLKVLAGTPASSPVAPTLTQTDSGIWQQLIANVAVAANVFSIEDADVTDERKFLLSVPAIEAALETKANKTQVVRNTTSDTAITTADNGNIVRLTGSTGRTITINNVLSVGQGVDFLQDGTGQITFAAGSGVTLRSVDNKLKTNKQYSGATVRCVASGIYHLVGDVVA
jgi:hypothetical protein